MKLATLKCSFNCAQSEEKSPDFIAMCGEDFEFASFKFWFEVEFNQILSSLTSVLASKLMKMQNSVYFCWI